MDMPSAKAVVDVSGREEGTADRQRRPVPLDPGRLFEPQDLLGTLGFAHGLKSH